MNKSLALFLWVLCYTYFFGDRDNFIEGDLEAGDDSYYNLFNLIIGTLLWSRYGIFSGIKWIFGTSFLGESVVLMFNEGLFRLEKIISSEFKVILWGRIDV